MASRKWYIQYKDSVHGPFSSSQLRQMAERSQLTPDVKIRVGENGSWHLASSVKGLFTKDSVNNDPIGSASSSDDISFTEADSDADSDSDTPSNFSETSSFDQPQKSVSSSSSFGEIKSTPPPIPGEVSVPGEVPVIGRVPHLGDYPLNGNAPPPHNSSYNNFGEIPPSVSPPGVPGQDLPYSSKHHGKRHRQTSTAIPALIQELIDPGEQVLYAAHPASIVLIIQCAIAATLYLLLGFLPSFMAFINYNAGPGAFYFIFTTIILLIVLAICFLRWFRSCYVITTQRTFVKRGIFSVEVAYVYNANIQMIKIKTGIIDQLIHSNTIQIRTSAGYLTLRWTPLAEVLKYYKK